MINKVSSCTGSFSYLSDQPAQQYNFSKILKVAAVFACVLSFGVEGKRMQCSSYPYWREGDPYVWPSAGGPPPGCKYL